MFFDPMYLVFVGPALLFGLWAQSQVSSAFAQYSRVWNLHGLTGADVARRILDAAGLHHVRVERIAGQLTDHYDPREEVIRLSDPVYSSPSIAAAGIAAHECGHALQHARNYVPLMARNAVIPATQFASNLAMPLFIIGLFIHLSALVWAGVLLFSVAMIFQFITLPVEFDASARALRVLNGQGYLSEQEMIGARKVLRAAALTYVAAALMALMQLLYFLGIARQNDD